MVIVSFSANVKSPVAAILSLAVIPDKISILSFFCILPVLTGTLFIRFCWFTRQTKVPDTSSWQTADCGIRTLRLEYVEVS